MQFSAKIENIKKPFPITSQVIQNSEQCKAFLLCSHADGGATGSCKFGLGPAGVLTVIVGSHRCNGLDLLFYCRQVASDFAANRVLKTSS